MPGKILCALFAHPAPPIEASAGDTSAWTAWTHSGRGRFYRTRICRRCGTVLEEFDG
jgi:hypothetical protein